MESFFKTSSRFSSEWRYLLTGVPEFNKIVMFKIIRSFPKEKTASSAKQKPWSFHKKWNIWAHNFDLFPSPKLLSHPRVVSSFFSLVELKIDAPRAAKYDWMPTSIPPSLLTSCHEDMAFLFRLLATAIIVIYGDDLSLGFRKWSRFWARSFSPSLLGSLNWVFLQGFLESLMSGSCQVCSRMKKK